MSVRENLLLCLIAGAGPADHWLDRARLAKAVAALMENSDVPEDMDYPPTGDFYSTAFLSALSTDIEHLEASGLIAKSLDGAFFLASAKGWEHLEKSRIDSITRDVLQQARSEVLESAVTA